MPLASADPMKISVAFLLLLASTLAHADSVAWARGQWFDGTGFVPGTRWSVDGVFVERRPARIDRVVDLAERHVVPAFGDAHHHGIDSGQGIDDKIAAFLEAGHLLREESERDPGPAHARGAPQVEPARHDRRGVLQRRAHRERRPPRAAARLSRFASASSAGLKAEEMENRAYFVIDDEADLEAKWPAILAGKPDFIKTFLLFSEEFEKRREVPNVAQGARPRRCSPRSCARRMRSGLRVSTHVDTAADFRHAVEAGVDEINHLPQPDPRFSPDLSAYVIDAGHRAARGGEGHHRRDDRQHHRAPLGQRPAGGLAHGDAREPARQLHARCAMRA